MKTKVLVIGCGRWGTFIAWYLNSLGLDVSLYGRSTSKNMKELQEKRGNAYLKLEPEVKLITSLETISSFDIIAISISTQGMQSLMDELKQYDIKNKYFVLCMKGIEQRTLRRLSQIVEDNADSSNHIGVWIGPGHAQDFLSSIPNCMVIDSKEEETKKYLIELFSSDLIRFYYGKDLLGNEIGAATKNVIGIAAGILDGLHLSSLKGALMSRGTREISRLIKAMGGNELSAYGLCHLGDYEATVFSKHSHNREFGECFVKGIEYENLAEGYFTVEAVVSLGKKYGVDLPICNAVYSILYLKTDQKNTIISLFSRKLKEEF